MKKIIKNNEKINKKWWENNEKIEKKVTRASPQKAVPFCHRIAQTTPMHLQFSPHFSIFFSILLLRINSFLPAITPMAPRYAAITRIFTRRGNSINAFLAIFFFFFLLKKERKKKNCALFCESDCSMKELLIMF